MSKTPMNKLFAKQRLYSLKMYEGGDLQAHVNAFNNILADLTQLGVKVDGEDKAIILPCSLPSSYDHLVTTLTYGKETITPDSIYSTLLQHKQYHQSVEEGEGSSGEGFVCEGRSRLWRRQGKVSEFWKEKEVQVQGQKNMRMLWLQENWPLEEGLSK